MNANRSMTQVVQHGEDVVCVRGRRVARRIVDCVARAMAAVVDEDDEIVEQTVDVPAGAPHTGVTSGPGMKDKRETVPGRVVRERTPLAVDPTRLYPRVPDGRPPPASLPCPVRSRP